MSRATELLSRHALLWIIAVGALLRFSTIGIQDFWLDEIVTVQEIGQAPIDILKQVKSADSNPALTRSSRAAGSGSSAAASGACARCRRCSAR